MTNSVDPDQMASLQKPSDLDLHCLQRLGLHEQQDMGLVLAYPQTNQ